MQVFKRDGTAVPFDKSKILNAIKAANKDVSCYGNSSMSYKDVMKVATIVSHEIKNDDKDIVVE